MVAHPASTEFTAGLAEVLGSVELLGRISTFADDRLILVLTGLSSRLLGLWRAQRREVLYLYWMFTEYQYELQIRRQEEEEAESEEFHTEPAPNFEDAEALLQRLARRAHLPEAAGITRRSQ